MIELEDLYTFVEENFDFLLVVHQEELVFHCSQPLVSVAGYEKGRVRKGRKLEKLLTPESLDSFRKGMTYSREGAGFAAIFSPTTNPSLTIPMRVGHVVSGEDHVFLFFGTQVDGLSNSADWEKDERVKELSCLYAVAEWIEDSPSINAFFSRLPGILSRGMRFPDQTVVCSHYRDQRYGQAPSGDKLIRAGLVSGRKVVGEIVVGYQDQSLDLLPEEKQMVNLIASILSIALERKELAQHLSLKQAEEEELNLRLADLERKIEFTTNELEGRRQKLDLVEAYRDRVDKGLEEAKSWMETVSGAIPGDVALINRNRELLISNNDNYTPGSKCHKAIFGREKPCENCRLARIIREKAPVALTIQDGDRYLEVHAQPVYDAAHNVAGIVEFYRDVTLERTYQQQLRQADKLASLGQLVSGIGHEINNPNQFIRGNIKIIQQALEDIMPIVDDYRQKHPDLKIARLPYDFFREHVMTLIADMAHGSERIKGIVEGLRRFARRDEGLLIDQVDLNTLVEDCARLVHNEVHKRAEIKLELEPEVPTFTGNSQKIEQVLVNLIVNASHAIPEETKGLITVRTGTRDGQVVFQVEDNGKGMNESTLNKIFDPFFTTKRAKGGTGLGLPIAYRIVDEHGGNISVSSKPGEGTVFTVRIPLEEKKQESGAEKEERQDG